MTEAALLAEAAVDQSEFVLDKCLFVFTCLQRGVRMIQLEMIYGFYWSLSLETENKLRQSCAKLRLSSG